MTEAELARFSDAERQLHSVDSEVRRNAAIVLLSMGNEPALRPVLEVLEEAENPAVRADLVKAIGFTRDHRCFQALLELVDDPAESVRLAVGGALAGFTRPDEIRAMKELAARGSTPSRTKRLLFQALGRGLAFDAVPVLIQGLKESGKGGGQEVRTAAWDALKRISGRPLPADPAPWQEWWEANRVKSREEILEDRLRTLSRQMEAVKEDLRDRENRFEELLRVAMSAENGPPTTLLKALDSEHEQIREYAAFRLARLDGDRLNLLSPEEPQIHQTLRRALESDSVEMRRNVVSALVRLNGQGRADLLRRALQDKDPEVLLKAIEGIEKEWGAQAQSRLAELLGEHNDPRVREAAAKALGKLGAADAVPALLGALDDEAENVRWFATESLRKLKATRAVPRLSELLREDESARVREITATTLGELGQPAAVPALRKALEDGSERVRRRTAAALRALAASDPERMSIIAEDLAAHGFPGPAIEIWRQMIEDFSGREDARDRLVQARKNLAALLEEQKDFAGAAALYLELDEITGGAPEIRGKLVRCWLAANAVDKLLARMPVWLEGAGGEKLQHTVTLGCDAAATLAEKDRKQDALKLLNLLGEACQKAGEEKLLEEVNTVKKGLGG